VDILLLERLVPEALAWLDGEPARDALEVLAIVHMEDGGRGAAVHELQAHVAGLQVDLRLVHQVELAVVGGAAQAIEAGKTARRDQSSP